MSDNGQAIFERSHDETWVFPESTRYGIGYFLNGIFLKRERYMTGFFIKVLGLGLGIS